MSSLAVCALAVGAATLILAYSEPEFLTVVKETIYQLVKAGYKADKILAIMRFYCQDYQ